MTELQNDRMTDRTKTICPPIFDLGGIKTISKMTLIDRQCSNFDKKSLYQR